jgi:multiple sugar transport system ATP-binding protein
MSSVVFRAAAKAYNRAPALDNLDLEIESETLTVLCGPPRSGKSVLFRVLVGLEALDSGRIEVDGRDISGLPPAERPIGYVPQSFALFPHLTVYDNIAYPLKLAGVARAEIAQRVDRAAGILSLKPLLKKTPDKLSGGEKQRTAVARGLLKNARIFVLDDPLVGLDYKLRERLMDELKELRAELKATFLYATSDSLEALTMAQKLVVLDRGRVVQQGEADVVYHDPRHLRSLELIGFPQANILRGSSDGATVEAGPLRFSLVGGGPAGPIVAGFRPEALKPEGGRGVEGRCRVTIVENLGGEYVIHVEDKGAAMVMSFPVAERPAPAFDSEIAFSLSPADIVMFDATSGARLDLRAEAAR